MLPQHIQGASVGLIWKPFYMEDLTFYQWYFYSQTKNEDTIMLDTEGKIKCGLEICALLPASVHGL